METVMRKKNSSVGRILYTHRFYNSNIAEFPNLKGQNIGTPFPYQQVTTKEEGKVLNGRKK